MSRERAKELVEESRAALQAGAYARARSVAEEAVALAPEEPDAHHMRGLALARSGEGAAAVEALRTTRSLAPDDPKACYNLAVVLAGMTDAAGAREAAEATLALDSGHIGAQKIIAELDGVHLEPATPRDQAPAATPTEPRPGYETGNEHAFSFIERWGGAWTAAGWALTLLSLVAFVLVLTMLGPQIPQGNVTADAVSAIEASPFFVPAKLLGLFALFAVPVYAVLDLIDRRGSFLWLLPLMLCDFGGLGWIVLGIYMAVRRNPSG